MEPTHLFALSGSAVVTLFGMLYAIVSWVGKRIIAKQDEMIDKINDVHARISRLDVRLVRVETILEDDD
jgi:hypothetical protein